MDNDDGKVVTTSKTLIEFDQSIVPLASSVVEKDSNSLDLTISTAMGARITKSQVNGSGVSEGESVLDDKSMDGSSGDGGVGVGVGVGDGDNLSVAKESLMRKNVGVEKDLGEESIANDCEVEKEVKESEFGEKMDGVSVGSIESGDSKEVCGRKGFGANFLGGRSSSRRKSFDDTSSSIAQRTRNRVVTGEKEDTGDEDVARKGSGIGGEVDECNVFSVGDFVWGKVKSHPWWPGRIYDPSNASDFALKYKHEGRLLVAYFGDRTFAWCDPSQLKSFEENFEEMSKQSSLKTFVSAVEEAENEFGRLVKLQMTCSCARESQSSLPLVVNAGIKGGVHVLENEIAKFSIAQFKSLTLLADIRRLAAFNLVDNTLELTVLKNRLSAFDHAKFGYSLPINCEPVSIEDPVNEQGVPREASIRGPDDGDWFVVPEDQALGQNGLLTPHDMSQKRRKSKTIAELLGMDAKDELEANNMDSIESETPLGKSVVKSGKKRWKVSGDDQSSMHEVNGDDKFSKDEEQSAKLVPKSGRKKRKTIDENQRVVAGNSMSTRSSTRKKKEDSSTSCVEKASHGTEDGRGVKDQRKRGMVPQVSINDGPSVEEGYERVSPRERKLSKYLSPPYTNVLQRQRSSCSQTRSDTGGLVPSDVARMGERMAKTAGKLAGSPPIVKCSAETFQKSSNALNFKLEKTDPNHKTSKPNLISEVNGPEKSIASLNSVLHDIRSAALDPFYKRRDQSFDSIKGFLSSYRSSKYKNGPNYNFYKKSLAEDRQRKRKKNSSATMQGSDSKQKVLKKIDQQTPKPKPSKRSASKREQKLESKPDHEVSCGPSSSSATLVITFPAGFSLPTKQDIIEICCKFGNLDESKTEVVSESSTAKIVFVESSCAEAAMDSMQKSVPFGSAEVHYKIQHLGAVPVSKGKQVNMQNKKKSKSSETGGAKYPEKHPSVSPSPESEPLTVIFIKQKLEAMTSMLAQTDGKMSQEIKSNLENDVKELLKKVKKMTAASPSS